MIEALVYIDPGLGVLFFQGIVASVVGSVFVARRRIATFWRALFGRDKQSTENATPPEVSSRE